MSGPAVHIVNDWDDGWRVTVHPRRGMVRRKVTVTYVGAVVWAAWQLLRDGAR